MELIPVIKEKDLPDIIRDNYNICLESLYRFKVGAILVKKGYILSIGYNINKSHPLYGSKYPYMTMHAEGNCIYNAKKQKIDIKGSTIFIFRKGFRNCKPCKDCFNILKTNGIIKIIYTNIE